jgi:alginate O-acetyltransferase complex protein AlgI
MVFSSFIFIFYFLPIALLAYAISPRLLKNLSLAAASILFYSWGEPKFALIFLGFCLFNYLSARFISFFHEQSDGLTKAKIAIWSSVTFNVSALVYFKYANFFVGEFNRTISLFGASPVLWEKVILPIGISFTTFQSISYLVDVYRKKCSVEKNLIDYLLYAFLFPHLIAGPIVRYAEIQSELKSRSTRLNDLYEGILRFSKGLAKKVLIADVIGHTADTIFGSPVGSIAVSQAWVGMAAYTGQLYFDFSGYSDMAIGIARMFGFHFPDNFDRPNLANSFSDFWRRWHTSFGRWMRDYLYYPLGGNRCSAFRSYFNLWVVFLFSGFWHGAQWTFILWGAYHGLFMTMERLFLDRWTKNIPNAIKVLFTLFLVMLSRVLFRANDLPHALSYYKQMFASTVPQMPKLWGYLTSPYEITMLFLAYLICLYPLIPGWQKVSDSVIQKFSDNSKELVRAFTWTFLLILSVVALAGRDFSPFIYFQF